jgi:hypothetical protein
MRCADRNNSILKHILISEISRRLRAHHAKCWVTDAKVIKKSWVRQSFRQSHVRHDTCIFVFPLPLAVSDVINKLRNKHLDKLRNKHLARNVYIICPKHQFYEENWSLLSNQTKHLDKISHSPEWTNMTGDKRPHSSSSSYVNSSDATRMTTTTRNTSVTVKVSMEEDRFHSRLAIPSPQPVTHKPNLWRCEYRWRHYPHNRPSMERHPDLQRSHPNLPPFCRPLRYRRSCQCGTWIFVIWPDLFRHILTE